MLEGKTVLVIGARKGGYGETLARSAVQAGARVFGTTLIPEDAQEQAFFQDLGVTLLEAPLLFDAAHRDRVMEGLKDIQSSLGDHGVHKLDSVIHAVAGGFPRHPAVMKSVGDILTGKQTFNDLATTVKKDVFYVNAGSFEDTINGLAEITHPDTQYIALTYRGDLPYFISPTKKYLERIAVRMADQGNRTLIAALPEAWTQSSQFFKGIELGVLGNYMNALHRAECDSEPLRPAYERMRQSIAAIEGSDALLERIQGFLKEQWTDIDSSSDPAKVSGLVDDLFIRLRNEGSFSVLRRTVEEVSTFVREACGFLVVKEFIADGAYTPGDVRQVHYKDLLGASTIGLASPRPARPQRPSLNRKWIHFDRQEIRDTLTMYGDNFVFLDSAVLEDGPFHDGFMGYARFKVPTPEENPILKDHFVGMPLFGGHLQMEMAAQFGTFIVRHLLQSKKLVPILTGTEFPNLNTMAPPGEVLSIRAIIGMPKKRNISVDAVIENRFAQSRGIVRGMVVSERVLKKMLDSFKTSASS